MGSAASAESNPDWVPIANKNLESCKSMFEIQTKIAVGEITPEKLGEMFAALLDFCAESMTCTINEDRVIGPKASADVFAEVGEQYNGIKNSDVKVDSMSLVMDETGKNIKVDQLYTMTATANGEPVEGSTVTIRVTHTMTFNDDGKIDTWTQSYDTEKFESVRKQIILGGGSADAADRSSKKSKWFSIIHKFREGKAAPWWEALKGMDQAAATKAFNDAGYHNHVFLPQSAEGPCFCTWETKEEMTEADFQKFIDGPTGPGEGVFDNEVFSAMEGSALPPSVFVDGYTAPEIKPTGGATFFVLHDFKSAETTQKFWDAMKTMDPAAAAAGFQKLGFHNHTFIANDPAGPCHCYWECKEDIGEADFQTFIDGPNGPGEGIFTNTCFKIMDGGNTYPSFFAE